MANNGGFEEFEKRVMEKLLEGEDNVFKILRQQYEKASVKSRKLSGTGFFTVFEVPDDVIKLDSLRSFQFGDIIGSMDGVNDGVGFVLFVKNGVIDFLEGYTYGNEKFPETVLNYQLSFDSGQIRNCDKIRAKWQ